MSRNRIFIDTSAWYAIIDKNDQDHAAAVSKIQILDRPLVTSNYIFDEILTLLKTKDRVYHCNSIRPKVVGSRSFNFGSNNRRGRDKSLGNISPIRRQRF